MGLGGKVVFESLEMAGERLGSALAEAYPGGQSMNPEPVTTEQLDIATTVFAAAGVIGVAIGGGVVVQSVSELCGRRPDQD